MLNHKEIGVRVRKCREELGISTETLSSILGIQPVSVGLMERGIRTVTSQKAAILSDTFDVSID